MGYEALHLQTTASNNTAVGHQSMGNATVTGSNNVALGYQAGYNNTSSGANVYVGVGAGLTNTTSGCNTFIGVEAGRVYNPGAVNSFCTFVGGNSGIAMTTGQKNVILGSYSGNQGGLDIRTADNYIVLSDGDGNPLISTADNQTVALEGAVPNSGTGITFPATQSASSNANTLDDYEEGTWTATLTPLTSGSITLSAATCSYTKVGRQVTINGQVNTSAVASPVGRLRLGGLPFTSASGTQFESRAVLTVDGAVAIIAIDSWLPNAAAFIDIYPAGTTTDTYASNIDGSTSVNFSATYFV
jgi:hypothetical protein